MDGTWEEFQAGDNVSESGGASSGDSGNSAVVYPTGKNKSSVVTGDIVKIGSEEFYVVKHSGRDLVLLSHYNLNVGSNKKANVPEGIQDSEVKAYVYNGTKYGNVSFSSTNYWNGKVGDELIYPGIYCSNTNHNDETNCAYIYYDKDEVINSNNTISTYVNAYKLKLEEMGATIKSARLLRIEEVYELGCGKGTSGCSNSPAYAPLWVYETSYWFGTAYNTFSVWGLSSNGSFSPNNCTNVNNFGVRPVIVI